MLRTAQRMDQALSGRVLIRAELRWPSLGGIDLAGRRVLATVAYGKQILTRLAAAEAPAGQRMMTASPAPLTLRSHLRMEGRWSILPPGDRHWPARSAGPSVRAVLGNLEWTAVGTWLGLLDLVPTAQEHTLIGHLGPDIMAPDLGERGLGEGQRRLEAWPDREIGAALLDQTGVAGIGTMYMAEALFMQRISPWTPVSEVAVRSLLLLARQLLINGARSAVPSTTGNPRRGFEVWVHGRSGKPCHRCGRTVRVAPIGQAPKERPAFYCPTCQPGPTPTDDGRERRPLGANPQYRENRRPTGYRRP